MMDNRVNKSAYKGTLKELAAELGLPFLEPDQIHADPSLFAELPVEVATRLLVLPLKLEEAGLHVAVADPLDLGIEPRLAADTGRKIHLAVADPEVISAALTRADSSRRVLENVSQAYRRQIITEDASGSETVLDLATVQDQDGIVQLTNSILMSALQRRASDVHIEAYADRVDLKYRIDGVLVEAADPIGVRHHFELVSRIKVMAELDIAERRVPRMAAFACGSMAATSISGFRSCPPSLAKTW